MRADARHSSSLAAIGFALHGCTTLVVPPTQPVDPVSVMIVDYGRHSSLIFPSEEGGLVEFAYGEWKWFALMQNQWHRLPAALFWPTQGTLGRRELANHAAPELAHRIGAQHLFAIMVERTRMAAVRDSLEQQHASQIGQKVYNQTHQLTFVPDEHDYSAFHNCNHGTCEWLESLGCKVGWTALIANFQVRPPPSPTQTGPRAEESDDSLLGTP